MIQRRLIPSYIFLIIMSFLSVFPFYWMISAATNTSRDVAAGRLLPGLEFINNFNNLLAIKGTLNIDLWRCMGNSALYAIVQTIVALIICSLAGYGFELYNDKGKDRVFTVLLMAMLIPGVATMIPQFKLIANLKLLNTVWGFMLPGISTPFLIMMFRNNSRNFPVSIMEAARMDGLSEFMIFVRMYVPVMKATYAAAAVITFMNSWNSYLWPRIIMTNNSAQTMPILLNNISSGYTVDYGMLMVAVLFCSVPTMVVFFVLQKQFAEGITGSVK